jgi:hypothetical protein
MHGGGPSTFCLRPLDCRTPHTRPDSRQQVGTGREWPDAEAAAVQEAAEKKRKKCIFWGAGRCFIVPVALRQNSVQTRHGGFFAARSRPHWPWASQLAPFSRTGPTQGLWNSLELAGTRKKRLETFCFFSNFCKTFSTSISPILVYGVFEIPLLTNAQNKDGKK